MAKKILFVYSSESKTGLSNKAKKIEQGFLDAGCSLDAIYLGSGGKQYRRAAEMLMIFLRAGKKIIGGQHDVVFIRYAYYFFPLYLLVFCMRKNLQVEVNSNTTSELLARGQAIRAMIDKVTMRFVRLAASRIHVASKSLATDLKSEFPNANYIFTANFVVDEHYSPREDKKDKKIKLVFMGNCAQKWHGIPIFLDVILGVDADWFKSTHELHFVGHVDEESRRAIIRNGLDCCVHTHGMLFGDAKYAVLREMDIGLSGFDLKCIDLKDTTGIKMGEYLYNGLGLIIGYEDPVIPSTLPFVLSLDLYGNLDAERRKFREFIAAFRNIQGVVASAHQYACDHLMVKNYIDHIIGDYSVHA